MDADREERARRRGLHPVRGTNVTEAAFEETSEAWLRTEAVAAYDALKADPSRAIPAENVRAEFEAKGAAREERIP